MKIVTRLALLIGSQSRYGGFLPGVKKDLRRMRNFLLSPNGGAWRENEIIQIENPGSQQVTELVNRLSADYTLTYFAGHGYTEEGDCRMLCLPNEDIQDLLLLNHSLRQLLIIDACRDYRKPGAAVSGIPREWQEWLGASGHSLSRERFDQYIANSPAGIKVIHGTADGHTAFEDGRRKGGQFTLALLDAVFMMQENRKFIPVSVNRVIEETSKMLRNEMGQQVPSVVYESGQLMVPFASTSPDFSPVYPDERSRQMIGQNDGMKNIFLLAGAGLVLYGLSQLK